MNKAMSNEKKLNCLQSLNKNKFNPLRVHGFQN